MPRNKRKTPRAGNTLRVCHAPNCEGDVAGFHYLVIKRLAQGGHGTILDHLHVIDFFPNDQRGFLYAEPLQKTQNNNVPLIVCEIIPDRGRGRSG